MRGVVGVAAGWVSISVVAGVLAAHPVVFAQAKPKPAPASAGVETFTGTATNVPKAGEPFTFRLSRWSTEGDRDKLLAAFTEKGAEGVQAALAAAQTLGYIWTSEPLGYSLRYAFRIQQPDGGARIILATDRKLDLTGRASTVKPSEQKADEYPFTVIELRLNRKGAGEGRTSLTSKIGPDPAAKTIALENYEQATVVFKNVREEGAR